MLPSRSRTVGLRVRGETALESSRSRLTLSSSAIASRPFSRPRFSVSTSASFCVAKESQERSSSSSSVSGAASIGTWSSEQEGDTMSRSVPIVEARPSSWSSELPKSLSQTFRPSTTPAERCLSSGKP